MRFFGSETAPFSLGADDLARIARENPRAGHLAATREDPHRLPVTVLVGNVAVRSISARLSV